MIVFSIGLPSQFALWCDRLTTKLAELSCGGGAAGAVHAVEANSLEDVAVAAVRTNADHLVVCSRQPGNRLQFEIVHNNQPFVVAFGDPRAAVYRLLASKAADLGWATRRVASGCAAMQALASAPNALVLTTAFAADPVAAATAITQHLGLPVGADAIAGAVHELAAEFGLPDDAAADDTPSGLDERAQAVVDGAILPYVRLAQGTALEGLVWERELFFLSDDPPSEPQAAATRPVELRGVARVLFYGPFITLPPGEWSANVALAFSAETAGMRFLLDIYAGQQLTHTIVDSAGAQVIDVTFRFTVAPTLELPIEVRVQNEHAAGAGQVALGRVTLRPEKGIDRAVHDFLAQAVRV